MRERERERETEKEDEEDNAKFYWSQDEGKVSNRWNRFASQNLASSPREFELLIQEEISPFLVGR